MPRINLVYTPRAERRRGYAAALLAAVRAAEPATGAVACTLDAGLANATSNRIYRRIGYRVAAETAHIRFERP